MNLPIPYMYHIIIGKRRINNTESVAFTISVDCRPLVTYGHEGVRGFCNCGIMSLPIHIAHWTDLSRNDAAQIQKREWRSRESALKAGGQRRSRRARSRLQVLLKSHRYASRAPTAVPFLTPRAKTCLLHSR